MHDFLFNNYLTRGFWGDEAWTAGISRLSLGEILRITGQDFHPPLYYFLVHFVGAPSNYKEIPVRLLSVFFYLLTPVFTYLLARRLFPKLSTMYYCLTTCLIALSPILITYALEARSYALLAFESVLSAYFFWRAKSEKKGHHLFRLAYFIVGSLMVYTHYYAWFILASHGVYLFLFERNRIKSLLPSALGILLVQLPWLPTLLGQTSSVSGSYWIGPMNRYTHWEFLYRVAGGDITSTWQKPLGFVLGVVPLVHLVYTLWRGKVSPAHRFLLTWLLVPTIIPTAISLVMFPVFFYRYLIFSAIPLILLFVYALSQLPQKLMFITFATVALMYLIIDFKIWRQHPRSMREATAELYQVKQKGVGPVYTVLPAFAEVMYYTSPYDEIIVSPEGLVQFSGKSLLDAYVRLGLTSIKAPPEKGYYYLSPDKQVELR